MPLTENEFQKCVVRLDGDLKAQPPVNCCENAGRNTAYRRTTWADVGGYPEWLTLTAEDALFNFQLEKTGKRFHFQPSAVVAWEVRKTPTAYFKMLSSYGYGSAEAQLGSSYYLRRECSSPFLPPLLIFSNHRLRFLGLRYRKNFSSATGWIAGCIKGRRAPSADWKRVEGVWMSPEKRKNARLYPTVAARFKADYVRHKIFYIMYAA